MDFNNLASIWNQASPYLATLLALTGLSVAIEAVKNKFALEHPMVIQGVAVVFALAAAVIPAALGYLSANPQALGAHTAEILGGLTLTYRYIVQPGSARISKFRDNVEAEKAFRARQAAQTTAATVNVTGTAVSEASIAPAATVSTLSSEFDA